MKLINSFRRIREHVMWENTMLNDPLSRDFHAFDISHDCCAVKDDIFISCVYIRQVSVLEVSRFPSLTPMLPRIFVAPQGMISGEQRQHFKSVLKDISNLKSLIRKQFCYKISGRLTDWLTGILQFPESTLAWWYPMKCHACIMHLTLPRFGNSYKQDMEGVKIFKIRSRRRKKARLLPTKNCKIFLSSKNSPFGKGETKKIDSNSMDGCALNLHFAWLGNLMLTFESAACEQKEMLHFCHV